MKPVPPTTGTILWSLINAIGDLKQMKKIADFSIISLCIILLSGCTGMHQGVQPPPETLQQKFDQKFSSVGVKEMTADRVYPPSGWLAQDFAREIEASGLAKAVYFPSRPDDKVDAVLEAKFNVVMDPHMGKLMLKSILIGLTLFILEPVFWYDFDYALVGHVEIVKGENRIPIEEKTNSTISMKWLSMGEAQKMESEVIKNSKKSLFLQLIEKISKVPGN
jgi:hypothetical protein